MAKQFTKISRDIAMAVKTGGANPDSNATLRRILQNARSANMPKDKVEAAIKRASGQEQQNYETILYEGYGPHGIPIIVEAATDNPTRTIANIRVHFRKHGGAIGASGSVAYLFKHMGVIRLRPEGIDQDSLEFDLIDFGLEELGEGANDKGEKQVIIRCAFHNFGKLQAAIEARGLEPISAESEYIAPALVELPEEKATEVLACIDALEQDDDVQNVFHNLG